MKEFKPRHELDRTLNSGERQVSKVPHEIDKWHRWRYEEATRLIVPGQTVIDFGCGIGYGTKMMAQKAKCVLGIDDSRETITFAREHYDAENVMYVCSNITGINYFEPCDVGVAFEILEHLEYPGKFVELLKTSVKHTLVLSVPYVSVDLEKSDWHYKHYVEREVIELFVAAGFKIERLNVMMFSKGEAIFCVGTK